MNSETSANLSNFDNTQFFIGTPSKDEIKQYFMRQKRLADLKKLENSPDIESSPELSESFELYLQQRKKKAEDERAELLRNVKKEAHPSPVSSKQFSVGSIDDTVVSVSDETISDDSFLAMEKICEKTFHVKNESLLVEESRLDSIEAPSFLSNSSFMSPGMKNSPRNINRPSTILEVSESTTNRTGMSSYKTAQTTGTGTELSFNTAADCTGNTSTDTTYQKSHISVDSLEPSRRSQPALIDLTRDSLNDCSDSALLNSAMCDESTDKDDSNVPEFNDTLERIDYILKLNDKAAAIKKEETLRQAQKTPKQTCLLDLPITPNHIIASKLTPQNKKIGARITPKNSPLIKFSPAAAKSPATRSPGFNAWKKPTSATKPPGPFLSASKKYQHIQSPIASYIKQTPGAPACNLAGKTIAGITGKAMTPNFRDSESFVGNENQSSSSQKLAHVAKTKTITSTQVDDRRDTGRTPGGKQVKNLLTRATPEVKIHAGHIKRPENVISNIADRLNETNLSEQSFADLSLMSGNVSLQVIEPAKRAKN